MKLFIGIILSFAVAIAQVDSLEKCLLKQYEADRYQNTEALLKIAGELKEEMFAYVASHPLDSSRALSYKIKCARIEQNVFQKPVKAIKLYEQIIQQYGTYPGADEAFVHYIMLLIELRELERAEKIIAKMKYLQPESQYLVQMEQLYNIDKKSGTKPQ